MCFFFFFYNHSLPVSLVVNKRDLRHGYLKAEVGSGLCDQVRVEAHTETEILAGVFLHKN